MKPGTVVEVVIEGIGVLRNTFMPSSGETDLHNTNLQKPATHGTSKP